LTQAQPTDWHYVWLCIKSVAEFLYFVAGLVISGAAIYAAKQVKLAYVQLQIASEQLRTTKDISTATARRESVKLASEHCRYYAEHVLPAYDAALNKYNNQHCTFLNPVPTPQGVPPAPAFVINNGDFGQVNYDLNRITAEQWNAVRTEFVNVLNKLEAFAIPFAAGVADDATGFQETAPAFIANLNYLIPAVYYLRQTQGVRYASILKLFNIWNNRVAGNALRPLLQPLLQGIQRVVDAANNPIQPI
jgi:hypothetical protein